MKAAIERATKRIREEYDKCPDTFATDITRQDAAILNIQRACETALDMGHYLIRRERLGVFHGSRDVFDLLQRGGWLDASRALTMKNMIGFRNIAVHDYQTLQLHIVVSIISRHFSDFIAFSSSILRKDGGQ